jgi:hypothetical protein
VVAFAVQDSAWINYNSAEGRYSVVLPSQPEIGTQESATADGVKLIQYKATVVKDNAVFMVGYFDHIPGTTFSFDKARDGLVSAVKGTLLSESTISLGSSPGREIKVVAKSEQGAEHLLHARFFDVDKRVYVLQYVILKSENSNTTPANAAKYFDSFKVLNYLLAKRNIDATRYRHYNRRRAQSLNNNAFSLQIFAQHAGHVLRIHLCSDGVGSTAAAVD